MQHTLILTVVLVVYSIPKGFFPIEDTGYIIGGTEAAEDTSFTGMVDKQMKLEAAFTEFEKKF